MQSICQEMENKKQQTFISHSWGTLFIFSIITTMPWPSIKSRNKGSTYERVLAKSYRNVWFLDCVTARSESKRTDDRWIDLCFTPPFIVQAKCYKNFWVAQAIHTLKHMPDESEYRICNVKISRKDRPADRKWSIVVLLEDDWFEIVQMLKSNQII